MTNPDGSIVRLEGIHKWFGDHHVLKGLDFALREGDVQVVVGPSGSGKSTLLRCVNLLELPSAGHVWFEGKDITDVRKFEDLPEAAQSYLHYIEDFVGVPIVLVGVGPVLACGVRIKAGAR